VVGSGPSGSIAALELMRNGIETTLIDQAEVGSIGEAQLLLQISRGKRIKSNLVLLRDSEKYFMNKSHKARKKLKFGQDLREYYSLSSRNNSSTNLGLSSKSKGGFSEIWGAVVNIPKSINNLSFSEEIWIELASTFKEVIGELPATQKFNAVLPNGIQLEFGSNSNLLFTPIQTRLKSVKDQCPNLFLANLALKTSGDNACMGCQKCMMGCPADSIYSSRMLVDRLISEGLQYRTSTKVLAISENLEGVEVTISSAGEISQLVCKRLFLAGGPAATAHILINSLEIGHPIEMKDTPIVYGIHLAWKVINRNRNHSLCELILDKSDLPRGVYMQFYTLESSTLGAFLGSKGLFTKMAMRAVLLFRKYLIVSITYLPAVNSFNYSEEGVKPTSTSNLTLKKSYSSAIVRTVSELIKVGIVAIPIVFAVSEKGSSMHFGSSFPYSKSNQNKTRYSDEYGRVGGLQNVHIVDSSILPDAIVGPPTLTIMANSMRIVRKVLRELD